MVQFVFFCIAFISCVPLINATCTCKNPQWCKPISTPFPEREIFTFVTSNDNWKLYNWNKITTIALFLSPVDPELVCFSHSKGIRVVTGADFPVANLTSETDRHRWVRQQLDFIQTNNLDGINIDFETPIERWERSERDGLSLIVWEMYKALKSISPYYQITFDTPFMPMKEAGRVYDYVEISMAIDFYVIMDYDISGSDLPWANSPLNITELGIQLFINEGIPASKLVLGVPWYGYVYSCATLLDDICVLDKPGSQLNYNTIVEAYLPLAIGGRKFDTTSMSPYFNYQDKYGHYYQIWYDDPQSLSYKYQYAVESKMRGVAMWHADALDYGNSTQGQKMRQEMWETLPTPKHYM